MRRIVQVQPDLSELPMDIKACLMRNNSLSALSLFIAKSQNCATFMQQVFHRLLTASFAKNNIFF
jgi:hypothetical protein